MTYNIENDISIPQKSNLTSEVSQIGEMHFEGNVIPHAWFQHIKFENGNVDLISITLLSEIVYWYRPTYVRDEQTGKIISIKKKFKADALQKSKQALADQFGLTERQVKDSLSRLEKLGIITREYRIITLADGLKLANVLFIKIHPSRIREISFAHPPYDVQTSHPQRSNVAPPTLERQTNTETTTKTTHREREASASPPAPPPPSKKKPKEEEAEEKQTFFGNVELTPKQYDSLLKNYGIDKLKWMLAFLSAKLGANHGYDKRYKSHYHVLLPANWVHKAYEEETESKTKKTGTNDNRKKVMERFQHGKIYNGAECFIGENEIAFQRGQTNRSVRFKEFGFEEQFNNLLRLFSIKE